MPASEAAPLTFSQGTQASDCDNPPNYDLHGNGRDTSTKETFQVSADGASSCTFNINMLHSSDGTRLESPPTAPPTVLDRSSSDSVESLTPPPQPQDPDASSESSSQDQVIVIGSAIHHLWCLPITIGKSKVLGYVDSGAMSCIMQKAVF